MSGYMGEGLGTRGVDNRTASAHRVLLETPQQLTQPIPSVQPYFAGSRSSGFPGPPNQYYSYPQYSTFGDNQGSYAPQMPPNGHYVPNSFYRGPTGYQEQNPIPQPPHFVVPLQQMLPTPQNTGQPGPNPSPALVSSTTVQVVEDSLDNQPLFRREYSCKFCGQHIPNPSGEIMTKRTYRKEHTNKDSAEKCADHYEKMLMKVGEKNSDDLVRGLKVVTETIICTKCKCAVSYDDLVDCHFEFHDYNGLGVTLENMFTMTFGALNKRRSVDGTGSERAPGPETSSVDVGSGSVAGGSRPQNEISVAPLGVANRSASPIDSRASSSEVTSPTESGYGTDASVVRGGARNGHDAAGPVQLSVQTPAKGHPDSASGSGLVTPKKNVVSPPSVPKSSPPPPPPPATPPANSASTSSAAPKTAGASSGSMSSAASGKSASKNMRSPSSPVAISQSDITKKSPEKVEIPPSLISSQESGMTIDSVEYPMNIKSECGEPEPQPAPRESLKRTNSESDADFGIKKMLGVDRAGKDKLFICPCGFTGIDTEWERHRAKHGKPVDKSDTWRLCPYKRCYYRAEDSIDFIQHASMHFSRSFAIRGNPKLKN